MGSEQEPKPLPESMYRGGYLDSDKVVKQVLELFHHTENVTLYYPGSSSDISLTGIDGVRTIHADHTLTEEEIEAFASLESDAYSVDVHKWSPPREVDVVTFINASGIDPLKVLELTQVRAGGLVVWAAWWGESDELQNSDSLKLIARAAYTEDEEYLIYTGNLDHIDGSFFVYRYLG